MKLVNIVISGLIFFASNSAMANIDLAKSKNCMVCHTVDNKVLGPAFKDVAKKYNADKTAETKLVTKVIKGGSGVWGTMPMPANSQVSPAEAQTLVKWILSLK